MPEKMKICPNCNQRLSYNHWDYYDSAEDWYARREEWSCECPNCKKIIWVKLFYELNENNIEIEVEGD